MNGCAVVLVSYGNTTPSGAIRDGCKKPKPSENSGKSRAWFAGVARFGVFLTVFTPLYRGDPNKKLCAP